jgi:transposase
MSHANAWLTPRGRLRLASAVVDRGWSLRRAAERFQCSVSTAKKWADRYRAGGESAMVDRSSRPHRSPHRLPQRRERRIVKRRFSRRWGPHRIATHLHLPRSTVEAVLRRYGMPLLRHLDQNTGLPVCRPVPRRYEHAAPGDRGQIRTLMLAGPTSCRPVVSAIPEQRSLSSKPTLRRAGVTSSICSNMSASVCCCQPRKPSQSAT